LGGANKRAFFPNPFGNGGLLEQGGCGPTKKNLFHFKHPLSFSLVSAPTPPPPPACAAITSLRGFATRPCILAGFGSKSSCENRARPARLLVYADPVVPVVGLARYQSPAGARRCRGQRGQG